MHTNVQQLVTRYTLAMVIGCSQLQRDPCAIYKRPSIAHIEEKMFENAPSQPVEAIWGTHCSPLPWGIILMRSEWIFISVGKNLIWSISRHQLQKVSRGRRSRFFFERDYTIDICPSVPEEVGACLQMTWISIGCLKDVERYLGHRHPLLEVE